MSDEYQLDMKVLQWREMVRQGKGSQITREEMKLAVAALRGERQLAQTVKESKPKEKKAAAGKDASGLLADFLGQTGGNSLKLPDENAGEGESPVG